MSRIGSIRASRARVAAATSVARGAGGRVRVGVVGVVGTVSAVGAFGASRSGSGVHGVLAAFALVATVSLVSAAPAYAEAPVAAASAAAAPPGATPAAVASAGAAQPQDLSRYKEAEVSGGGLLVAAYCAMWVLLALFAGRLALQQSRTTASLRALEERIERSLVAER